MKALTIILCAFCSVFQVNAQTNSTPSPIIFIYDASGSMLGKVQGKTKMEIAVSVLSDAVSKLPDNQKVGLVAYGHRKKDDCKDVEFLVDVENGTKTVVNQSLKNIKPLGKTPLAQSALQVIDKLRSSKMKATIILVTDGIESCGGNICDVVTAAKKEGIDFRLHIIGFGLKAGETEQLKCAAKAGEGQYYDAADAGALGDVLNEATTATVDKPVANFSVFAIKNGKPIDALVRAYKAGTSKSIASVRTYRDTGLLYMPAGTYELEVRPLENSDVKAITISKVQSFEDKKIHQTVSFDGAKIQISAFNNGKGWDAVVKIYSKETGKNVAGGRTYGKSDIYEVNPGLYDVEMRAMVVEGLENTYRIENVEIHAGDVKALEHNFITGIAMIGAKTGSGLADATVNIIEEKTKKNVAGGRTYTAANSNPNKFILSPGTYQVTLATVGELKGKKQTFTLVIKGGETVEKMINF